jgi:Tol biopolymer transport system component
LMTSDGQFVCFASTALNLADGPTNAYRVPSLLGNFNVYLRDRSINMTMPVSVDHAGQLAQTANCVPLGISEDGRFVLFETESGELPSEDTNGVGDIYIRDVPSGKTVLVSVSAEGDLANGPSTEGNMTQDGHYVAFVSAASNLVAGDTNEIPDVFVRDLVLGTTVCVCTGATKFGRVGPWIGSEAPVISDDGSLVAFSSTAAGLGGAPELMNGIYLYDLPTGRTVCASKDALELVGVAFGCTNVVCHDFAMSSTGRYVAFQASPSPAGAFERVSAVLRYDSQTDTTQLLHTNALALQNGVEGSGNLALTPDGRFVVFVANNGDIAGSNSCLVRWDCDIGQGKFVSLDPEGNLPTLGDCLFPATDATGRFIAFFAHGMQLVTNALSGEWQLYMRDMDQDQTTCINADGYGRTAPVFPVSKPELTADGTGVVYEGLDATLVPWDSNRAYDVFAWNRFSKGTDLISERGVTLGSSTPSGNSALSAVSFSASGQYVAFTSDADRMVPTDTNGLADVFVRDLDAATPILVSIGTNGVPANGRSRNPSLSGDGRYVVFSSFADNLVPGDTNNAEDIFLRDLQTGTMTVVSVNSNGTAHANGASTEPVISRDGGFVLFRSRARDLANWPFISSQDQFFMRDVRLGTNYSFGTSYASMSPDGRYVAIAGYYAGRLFFWDNAAGRVAMSNIVNVSTHLINVLLGSEAKICLAQSYLTGEYYALQPDLQNGVITNTILLGRMRVPALSADNRFLAFSPYPAIGSAPPKVDAIYLYDFLEGTTSLVSHSFGSTNLPNETSDSAVISPDGRFVAYSSSATDLVAWGTEQMRTVYLYDRCKDETIAVAGHGAPSTRPVFSPDGKRLLFQTWDSSLISDDFNQNGDLVSYELPMAELEPIHIRISLLPSGLPQLSWTTSPGLGYRVLISSVLSDSPWMPSAQSPLMTNQQATWSDPEPPVSARYYRVIAEPQNSL